MIEVIVIVCLWLLIRTVDIKGASPIVCHFEAPVSSKNDGRLEVSKVWAEVM